MKYIFTSLIIILLFSISCAENDGNKSVENIDSSENKNISVSDGNLQLPDEQDESRMQSGIWDMSQLHEPLDSNMFTDFRSNNIYLNRIKIYINMTVLNPYSSKGCVIQSNPNHVVTFFNGIVSYDASLNTYSSYSEEHCYYENILLPNQLESLFTYLEQYSDFFFNNEEFEGLELPYLTEDLYFDAKNYDFALDIYDPSSLNGPWLSYNINKSQDDLPPDSELYGLFQILENDIVPIIMQNEIWCK